MNHLYLVGIYNFEYENNLARHKFDDMRVKHF